MLLARIQLVAGPQRGAVSYARVDRATDGTFRYLPVPDPFEPAAGAGSIAMEPAEPVDAADAVLLAPCRPRVVLGMAHNTGPADRLLPPQAFHKSPHSVIGPGMRSNWRPDRTRSTERPSSPLSSAPQRGT